MISDLWSKFVKASADCQQVDNLAEMSLDMAQTLPIKGY